MAERQYWDAVCWIDFVNEGGDLTGPMTAIWKSVGKTLELIITPVILCEVLLQKSNTPRPWTDPHPADDMFNADGVIMAQIDRRIGERARSLRRRFKLKSPDALHLATCLLLNVEVLVTRDGSDLLGLPTMLREDGQPLHITNPDGAATGPLFAGAKPSA